jgi:SpoVK/Ycf46/Vps4 family AAA+-type ATPase
VSHISVLVVKASGDVKAEAIAEAIADSVAARPDMDLIEGSFGDKSRCVPLDEVDGILTAIEPAAHCALVLMGRVAETNELALRWLQIRDDLVVMQVDVADDMVRIGLHDPRLDSLLSALRELVEGRGTQNWGRFTRVRLRPVESPSEDDSSDDDDSSSEDGSAQRSLLDASIDWIHALLRNAIEKASDDVNGLTVTRKALVESLGESSDDPVNNQQLDDAEESLDRALADVDLNPEPLAAAVRVFNLGPLEFRLMVLTLAPELDLRYQRCIGFLMDEVGRRVGTMALYRSLLGLSPPSGVDLIDQTAARYWLVFEGNAGRSGSADEPLRLDPYLADWFRGDQQALSKDPRIRRVLRLVSWPGASILDAQEERAAELIEQLDTDNPAQWVLLDGDDPAAWRALVELGSLENHVRPIRVIPARLAAADLIDVEEVARRIGRLARLTHRPLIIDVTKTGGTEAEDDYLGLFLATLGLTSCRGAVICRDEARVVQLLGNASYELIAEPALSKAAHVEAVREVARGIGISYMDQESAESIANRYPLHVDGLEQAMRLAASRPKNYDHDNPDLERLTTALKELAAERISHLVERIEPVFSLEEVVLPPDRKQTLREIVDQIRLAPRVLDDWKFREKLPYGRGVAALFFGPSGTGKTMAAMGIARQLNIQILRLDLSRVVSKYIGETEKNLDRVFTDAQGSGAAILIDEADALFGKRSEVKDAHDRYANIEVAYLLQRLEAFEGLAILTTNMRKNLDAAFLRRLRFVVEFPRPDAEAREKIWRQCLPYESHELTDAEFRQLGRRIDLTGGQIRQVTLRAAFIAAAAEKQIGIEHIVQAASAELAKLGMPPIEADLLQTRRAAA